MKPTRVFEVTVNRCDDTKNEYWIAEISSLSAIQKARKLDDRKTIELVDREYVESYPITHCDCRLAGTIDG